VTDAATVLRVLDAVRPASVWLAGASFPYPAGCFPAARGLADMRALREAFGVETHF
jgi:hypothetical protein